MKEEARPLHPQYGWCYNKDLAPLEDTALSNYAEKNFQNFRLPTIRVALERLDKIRQKLALAGSLQRPASKGSSASSLFFMLFAGTLCNVGSSLTPHIDVLLCRPGRFHSLQPECLSRSYVGLVQSLLEQKSRGRKAITVVFVFDPS